MADASDSVFSNDSSSSQSDRAAYAEQWNALCEALGTSDPNEVLARVQTLKREMEGSGEDAKEGEGLVTISEVEEVFRQMNRKIEKLRERNAKLAEELEGDDENSGFRELHQKTEQVMEALDAATMDEARERIQQRNQRLERLYQEKETLVGAGLSDAEEALDELERLRDERDALRRERDDLEQELEGASESTSSRRADPDTSVLEAAVVIRDRVGISTPDQAEALTRIAKQLHERVQALAEAYGVAVDDTPEDLVEMLHSMATQLNAIPGPESLPADAAEVLGITSSSEARTLADTIRRVGRRLVEQYEGTVEFEQMEAEAEDAVGLLHTLEDRIQALPDRAPSRAETEGLPAEAGDILGIRTVEDARELDELIARVTERLEELEKEHEQLEEVGLSVDGALQMIENMGAQLAELYQDKPPSANGTSSSESGMSLSALDETTLQRITDLTDSAPEAADDMTEVVRTLVDQIDQKDAAAKQLAAIEDVLGISTQEEAEELSQLARRMEDQLTTLYEEKQKLEELGVSTIGDAVDMIKSMEEQLDDLYQDKEALRQAQLGATEQQSTFQQLEALYAEREKLQQALGVSDAADVIEMIESLNSQLDDLYTPRDAEVAPEERHEARLWSPEAEPAPAEDRDEASDDGERDDVGALTMSSMEHQLESLYREKETLLHHGFRSAQEVVDQLETQQNQIDALQRENHSFERRFDRLNSELGTENVPQIVELVKALESETDLSLEELRPSISGASESTDYGVDIEAASPFVPEETLAELDELPASELEALDMGVVQLSKDGNVEYLNETALRLPGLRSTDDPSEMVGQNFFLDLAPSTNNNLFFGRFRKGQRRGQIDARFPYTFTSPDEGPETFAVHLYQRPEAESTWLLFRPA